VEIPGITDAYGEIDHYSLGVGRTMGKNDLWIGATAHAEDLQAALDPFVRIAEELGSGRPFALAGA
jgi:predicted nucleic acid-binding protein